MSIMVDESELYFADATYNGEDPERTGFGSVYFYAHSLNDAVEFASFYYSDWDESLIEVGHATLRVLPPGYKQSDVMLTGAAQVTWAEWETAPKSTPPGGWTEGMWDPVYHNKGKASTT